MENTNFTKGDLLMDEVNVDLDVLGLAVMDRVCCHVYSTTLLHKTTVAEGSGRWSSWRSWRDQQHSTTRG
jgi:hypothetical protein